MNRDRNRFWELVEPEHRRAQAFCRKLAGDRDNGDDLYQDALVAALNSFDRLKDCMAFRGWLYRIIINSYRNSLRRPWWKLISPLTPEIEKSVSSGDPVAKHTARRHLERAFKALSADERSLVTLFELEGWSISDLATVYGKSEGTIKVRLFRARRKMRETLARFLSTPEQRGSENTLLSEVGVCVATKPGTE